MLALDGRCVVVDVFDVVVNVDVVINVDVVVNVDVNEIVDAGLCPVVVEHDWRLF